MRAEADVHPPDRVGPFSPPPMTYPSELELDVVLRDGEVVHLRPIRPDDADLERRFFARVSPDSSYFRFFRYKRELTDEELAHFVIVDYRDRMAFVAFAGEEMIAVGRYDLLETEDSRRVAEVAFLVEDQFQGRGVGTLLLQHLAFYARLHGISAFRAFVLSDNRSMLNVFRDSGYEVVREDLRRGIYELELETSYSDQARSADAGRERQATAASLDALFRPRSVAVVGASRDEHSIGGRLIGNLLMTGFWGPVYPINPSADVVRSVKAYPSVLDVPGPVDLGLIVVPASSALSVVEECARKGVKAVVVISAGFAETGPAGIRLEAQLLEAVREGGMRMVGPNCMGLLNTDPEVRLNAQFGPVFPPAGKVAMSSQSGALGLAVLDYAREINIGISSFVSVGNKADVSGNDLLLYWEDDPNTDVILLYLESFGNPRRFARLAKRIGRKKPIAAVKSGRSATGARAAASHTGSLANVEVAVEALFRQTGVIRVDTLNELFDVTALLANQPVPGGRRVAILTNAGGPAVLCADVLEAEGLELPTLSDELQARLRGHLPAEASTGNPIDMIGSAGPEQYEACLEELLGSEEADAVIVIYIPATPGGGARVAEAIRGVAPQAGAKTLLAVFMQSQGAPTELAEAGVSIPAYPYPEPAGKALASAVRYGEWRARPEGRFVTFEDIDSPAVRSVIKESLARLGEEGGWLGPEEVAELMRAVGLPTVESLTAKTAEEAVELAQSLGTPVVLKVLSPSVIHKSDVGGVALDLKSPDEIGAGFERVIGAVPDALGALVQEQLRGHEVIIGMTEEPTFGPLIAFGLGGVYVELLADVAFRIHPLTDIDVEEMIRDVKSARLLDGYRGAPAGDLRALSEAMHRVSALIELAPEIAEMDLNPVMVLAPGQGVRVVDARVRVRAVETVWLPSRKDLPGQIGSR